MSAQELAHVTVLLHEAVDALAVKPDGVYVDGTFGRGGHSRLILSKLGANGRLVVFDKDPQAIAVARQLAAQAVRTRERGQDPATRTFQAIRIFINRELEEISAVLPQAAGYLKTGGRLAVIAFHSLEDRIVKQFIRRHSRPVPLPKWVMVRESERPEPPLREIGKAQRASAAETAANPRARSAVLRVAERTAGEFADE